LSDYEGEQPQSREEILIQRLVHELAHVRMFIFLEENADILAREWPEYIQKRDDGKYRIYGQFETFLLEAHAWRLQYDVYASLLRNGYNVGFSKFGLLRSLPLPWNKGCINCSVDSVMISEKGNYGIYDPRIAALAGVPLLSIMKGKGRVQDPQVPIRQKFNFLYALSTLKGPKQEDIDLTINWFSDSTSPQELKFEILHALVETPMFGKLYSRLNWSEKRRINQLWVGRYGAGPPLMARLRSFIIR